MRGGPRSRRLQVFAVVLSAALSLFAALEATDEARLVVVVGLWASAFAAGAAVAALVASTARDR